MTRDELKHLHPRQIRELIREGKFRDHTSGIGEGYTQANLVILPKESAFDFLLFCQRNPKPCPVLEVTDPGSPLLKELADKADLRTDLPKYRIYKKGELINEVADIQNSWRDDLVGFLLGCSYTFEYALLNANIPLRHVSEGKNVAMYITDIQCKPSGRFAGPMVVSMRPIHRDLVVRAIQVTTRFPFTHGAPIHFGDPEVIGIHDLEKVDFGEPVRIEPDEVPVFWACGVTPQAVALHAKLDFIITHSPGHMFISDIKDEELAVL
ncbi:MAG: putative hydro-lyase [Candidatus Tectomicrobia bacterium]|nr:putative hydro-lyase [Candidatus Tectomicrobia bacterium]